MVMHENRLKGSVAIITGWSGHGEAIAKGICAGKAPSSSLPAAL